MRTRKRLSPNNLTSSLSCFPLQSPSTSPSSRLSLPLALFSLLPLSNLLSSLTPQILPFQKAATPLQTRQQAPLFPLLTLPTLPVTLRALLPFLSSLSLLLKTFCPKRILKKIPIRVKLDSMKRKWKKSRRERGRGERGERGK